MSRTVVVLRWCATCRADVEFEQPECVDEHSPDCPDCPEWACAQCGDAYFVGFDSFAAPPAGGRRTRQATHVA